MLKRTTKLVLISVFCLSLLFSLSSNALNGKSVSSSSHSPLNSTVVSQVSMPEVVNNSIEVPDNFNPLTATADELKKYGFPRKPTNKTDALAWEEVMKYAKHYVKPIQIPSKSTHITSYSTNWAGYVGPSSINNNVLFTDAQAEWKQPNTVANANPSFWVGIGGYSTQNLVQAGCDSNASWSGGSSTYEFWVEDYPAGTIWQATPAVHAGDTVYVHVTYSGSQSSAYLLNETTGNYTTAYFNSPYYDGLSADFIHEAMGGVYSSWGSVDFKSCYYSGLGQGGMLSTLNRIRINMTDTGTSTGTPEATTGDVVSDTTFTVTSR